MGNRVYCLYKVSTGRQVDCSDKSRAEHAKAAGVYRGDKLHIDFNIALEQFALDSSTFAA